MRFEPYVQNTPYPNESKDIEILSLAQKYDDVSLVATPTTIFQGETSQLKALVKQDQKPLENGKVQITLLNGSGTISETKPVDGEPGAYTATYRGPSPTTANFGINIDDTPNNNAKAQVNVLGVSDVKATLEASKKSLDLQNGDNKQSVLTLKLTDNQNNPLNVSSAIIVENQPYKGILGDSIKQSNGVYTAQFEANTTGQADFYAYANNINLNVS
ncbi:invasin domain 3-containing protein, partial [Pseudomonas aeruginosa]|uniref:invasin domain 3-containing protein n=1 Tax=Pseudomonas aeruginosa TaxID=287 RepID=UPI0011C42072